MMVNEDAKEFSFNNLLNHSTVFSKTSKTLTLIIIFFCLMDGKTKLIFDKFKDNLFAFSQIDIFVSSLVMIEVS